MQLCSVNAMRVAEEASYFLCCQCCQSSLQRPGGFVLP